MVFRIFNRNSCKPFNTIILLTNHKNRDMKNEKGIFYWAIRRNMVDVIFWAVCLFFAIKKGVLDWYFENGFLLVFVMCFYGGFLIYRLGVRNKIQKKLIDKCKEAGIDLSDTLPPGTY